ncbi:hypothetical protein GH714_018692 [Hevea brasiliensis]|uniref:Uncharacterized protein n=1 Tax=Hevea brasiliensis TaxID=3981 RepID=A0A6A6LPV7_HEVBR|nr:hypothetical protein GH714_018692 [Hevea brasiliensis]
MCVEWIKDLRHPYDSTDDYLFDAEIADMGSSEEDYPSGFSEIDFLSDDDDYHEFFGGSDITSVVIFSNGMTLNSVDGLRW